MSAQLANYKSNPKPILEHSTQSPNKPVPSSQYYSNIIAPLRGNQQHFQQGAGVNSPSVSTTGYQNSLLYSSNSTYQNQQSQQMQGVLHHQQQHPQSQNNQNNTNQSSETLGEANQSKKNPGNTNIDGTINNQNLSNPNNNAKLTDILSTRFSQGNLRFIRNGLQNLNSNSIASTSNNTNNNNTNNNLQIQNNNLRQVSTDAKVGDSLSKIKCEYTNSPAQNSSVKAFSSSLLSHSISVQQNLIQSPQIQAASNKPKQRESSSQHCSLSQKPITNSQISLNPQTVLSSSIGTGFQNKSNFYNGGVNGGQIVNNLRDKQVQNESGKATSPRSSDYKNESSESAKRPSFIKKSENGKPTHAILQQAQVQQQQHPVANNSHLQQQNSYLQSHQVSIQINNLVSSSNSQTPSQQFYQQSGFVLPKQSKFANNVPDSFQKYQQLTASIQQGKHQASHSVERFGYQGDSIFESQNDGFGSSQKISFSTKSIPQKKQQNQEALDSKKQKKLLQQSSNHSLAGHVISYSRKQGSPEISESRSFSNKTGMMNINLGSRQPANNLISNQYNANSPLKHQSSLPHTNSSSYNLGGGFSATLSSMQGLSNTGNSKSPQNTAQEESNGQLTSCFHHSQNENTSQNQREQFNLPSSSISQVFSSSGFNYNSNNSPLSSDHGKSDRLQLNKSLHSQKQTSSTDNQGVGIATYPFAQSSGNKSTFHQLSSKIQSNLGFSGQKYDSQQQFSMFYHQQEDNYKQLKIERSFGGERSISQKREEQSQGGRRAISRGSLSEEFKMSQQSYQNLASSQGNGGDLLYTPVNSKCKQIDQDTFQDIQPFTLSCQPKIQQQSLQKQSQQSAQQQNIFGLQQISLSTTPQQQLIQHLEPSAFSQSQHESLKHQIYFLQDNNKVNYNKNNKIASKAIDSTDERLQSTNKKEKEHLSTKKKGDPVAPQQNNQVNQHQPQTFQHNSSPFVENSNFHTVLQPKLNIIPHLKGEESLLAQIKNLQQTLWGGIQKSEESQQPTEKVAFQQKREKRNSLQLFHTSESYLGDLNTNKPILICNHSDKQEIMSKSNELNEKLNVCKLEEKHQHQQSQQQQQQQQLQQQQQQQAQQSKLEAEQHQDERRTKKKTTHHKEEDQKQQIKIQQKQKVDIDSLKKINESQEKIEVQKEVLNEKNIEIVKPHKSSLISLNYLNELKAMNQKTQNILKMYQTKFKKYEESENVWKKQKKEFIEQLEEKDQDIDKLKKEALNSKQIQKENDEKILSLQQQLSNLQNQLGALQANSLRSKQSQRVVKNHILIQDPQRQQQNVHLKHNIVSNKNEEFKYNQFSNKENSFGQEEDEEEESADFQENKNPLETSFEKLKRKYQVKKQSISNNSSEKGGNRWKLEPTCISSQLNSAQKTIKQSTQKNSNGDIEQSPALNDSFTLLQNMSKSQGNSTNKNNPKINSSDKNSIKNISSCHLPQKSQQEREFPIVQQNLSFSQKILIPDSEQLNQISTNNYKEEIQSFQCEGDSPKLGNELNELEVIQTSFSPETFKKVKYEDDEQYSEDQQNDGGQFGTWKANEENGYEDQQNKFESSFQEGDNEIKKCESFNGENFGAAAEEDNYYPNSNKQNESRNMFEGSFAQRTNEDSFSQKPLNNNFLEEGGDSGNHQNKCLNSSFSAKLEDCQKAEIFGQNSGKIKNEQEQNVDWQATNINFNGSLNNSFGDCREIFDNIENEKNIKSNYEKLENSLGNQIFVQEEVECTQLPNISFTNQSFG